MKKNSACPGKGQDSNTTSKQVNEALAYKSTDLGLKILYHALKDNSKNGKLSLPDANLTLSHYQYSRDAAYRVLKTMEQRGFLVYVPFHHIVLKGGWV